LEYLGKLPRIQFKIEAGGAARFAANIGAFGT
jgi:hypothetical protein